MEWDDFDGGAYRGIVGGDYGELAGAMQAQAGVNLYGEDQIGGNLGFRIAMAVPEPGAASLLALAAALMAWRRSGSQV